MDLFDASGKLSHLLLFLLARFEGHLGAEGRPLPQFKDIDRLQVRLSDAEHITAFTQERQRMSKKKRVPRQSPESKRAELDSSWHQNRAKLQRERFSQKSTETSALPAREILMDHLGQEPRTPRHAEIVDPYLRHQETYHQLPPPRPNVFPALSASFRVASPQSSRELPNYSCHSQHFSNPPPQPKPQPQEIHRIDHFTQAPTLRSSSTNPHRLNPTQRQIPTDKSSVSYQRSENS